MSFLAKLIVDGHESNVLDCTFFLTQDTDGIGMPISIPQGGKIELTVESTRSTFLFEWMASPTMTKSGTITFFSRDTMSTFKALSFANAHCISYLEKYSHNGEYPMQISFVLSAKELNLNGSDFKNNWPE